MQYHSTLDEALAKQAALTELLRKRLEEGASGFGGNATFKDAPSVDEMLGYEMVRSLIWAIASGQRILYVGDSGIGKTKLIQQVVNLLDIDLVEIPLATVSVENLVIPFVLEGANGEKSIQALLYESLDNPRDKMVFFDEWGRKDKSMSNVSLEISQEGTIAGRQIPGLVGVVAADNPGSGRYGKIQSMDLAQASRFVTIPVDTTSTPWQHALAARFPETDLKPLFKLYGRLDREQRIGLSPAILESVVAMLIAGLPAIYGIPKIGGLRATVVNAAGRDTTDEVLGKVAEALGMPLRNPDEGTPLRALEFALREGFRLWQEGKGFTTFYGEGPPGVGKTALIKKILRDVSADLGMWTTLTVTGKTMTDEEQDALADKLAVVLSTPALSPEDLALPVVVNDRLRMVLMEFLQSGLPIVLVLDERWRAGADGARRTFNALMELEGSGSLGGQKVKGLVCIIALNNPREVAGYKMDVGIADPAQARRYRISVDFDSNSLPAAEWLRKTYGQLADPFVDWFTEDIGDLERLLVPPRVLEAMIRNYAGGIDIDKALPFVGNEFVPVSIADLRARLDSLPMARLRAMAADVDRWLADMDDPDRSTEARSAVLLAFQKAELALLKEHRKEVIQLLRKLDKEMRILLIKSPGRLVACGNCAACAAGRETSCTKRESRQSFWAEALRDMNGLS